jgi:hypothetical protein
MTESTPPIRDDDDHAIPGTGADTEPDDALSANPRGDSLAGLKWYDLETHRPVGDDTEGHHGLP